MPSIESARLQTRHRGSLLGFLLIIALVACVFFALHDDRRLYSPNWKVGDPIEDEEKPPTEVVEKRRTDVTPNVVSLQPGSQDQNRQKSIIEKPKGTLDRSDPLNVERVDSFDALIEKPNWNEPIFPTPRVKPEKE